MCIYICMCMCVLPVYKNDGSKGLNVMENSATTFQITPKAHKLQRHGKNCLKIQVRHGDVEACLCLRMLFW